MYSRPMQARQREILSFGVERLDEGTCRWPRPQGSMIRPSLASSNQRAAPAAAFHNYGFEERFAPYPNRGNQRNSYDRSNPPRQPVAQSTDMYSEQPMDFTYPIDIAEPFEFDSKPHSLFNFEVDRSPDYDERPHNVRMMHQQRGAGALPPKRRPGMMQQSNERNLPHDNGRFPMAVQQSNFEQRQENVPQNRKPGMMQQPNFQQRQENVQQNRRPGMMQPSSFQQRQENVPETSRPRIMQQPSFQQRQENVPQTSRPGMMAVPKCPQQQQDMPQMPMHNKPIRNPENAQMKMYVPVFPRTEVKKETASPDFIEKLSHPLRLLTVTPASIRIWYSSVQRFSIIFELFGILTTPVSCISQKVKRFCLKTQKDAIQCIYYEIDRPLPALIPNQWFRCVGSLDKSNSLKCVSVRPAEEIEVKHLELFVKKTADVFQLTSGGDREQ